MFARACQMSSRLQCNNNNILGKRSKAHRTAVMTLDIYQNQMTVRRKNDRINSNIIIYEYDAFSPFATVIFHIEPKKRIDCWYLQSTHRTTVVHVYKN